MTNAAAPDQLRRNQHATSFRRGGVFKTALYILLFPLYLLARLIPKDRRLYAFGSRHGMEFADNSKYLFLYASRHVPGVKCVFFSRDHATVKLLKAGGYRACDTLSLSGILTAIRAAKCFISNSTHDIHALLIGGAEVIQLWHGTPLKVICDDVDLTRLKPLARVKFAVRGALFRLLPYLNTSMKFSKLVIASRYVKKNFMSAFRVSEEKLLVLGQARNDCLEEGYQFDDNLFPETRWLEHRHRGSDAVVTWMPTHRLMSGVATENLLANYSFDLSQLLRVLKRHNANMVIKVHFLDRQGLGDRFADCERILVYGYPDPYPLLRYTDVLLTDYSSVYFDFLLLNRPIIFTPFDYERYVSKDAAFYYDYDEVTPGPKCRNWAEVVHALDEELGRRKSEHEDPYAVKRTELCRRFNDYVGGNSRRIIDALCESS